MLVVLVPGNELCLRFDAGSLWPSQTTRDSKSKGDCRPLSDQTWLSLRERDFDQRLWFGCRKPKLGRGFGWRRKFDLGSRVFGPLRTGSEWDDWSDRRPSCSRFRGLDHFDLENKSEDFREGSWIGKSAEAQILGLLSAKRKTCICFLMNLYSYLGNWGFIPCIKYPSWPGQSHTPAHNIIFISTPALRKTLLDYAAV